MRVLHLIKALGRGGAEVLLTEGLAVANLQRFEFSYGYLQTKPDDVAKDLRAQGSRVDCFHLDSNLQMLLGARRVARYLRERKIDLVHAHLPMAGVVARLAGRMVEVPVVYTEHSPAERYHPLVRKLNSLTWSWQQHAIAISDDVASSMQRQGGSGVPISTIWNGVNTTRFAPGKAQNSTVRDALGIPDDVPVVGTVAVLRDTPAKRLDVWLEAARLIHERVPHAHFLLVGGGPLREELERQSSEMGLSGVIHFAGHQRDVRPYLAQMDVFLMSSAYEGFGIALVEAMAMGVAVVATDVEGIRNIVASGDTGLLGAFDNSVAENLARNVIELLQQPKARERLAAAGRESTVQRFSIEQMQRELEQIYEHVLNRGDQAVISTF